MWRHRWKGRSGAPGAAGDGPGALLVWGESIKLPTCELCTVLDNWTCTFLMGVLKFSCHGSFLSGRSLQVPKADAKGTRCHLAGPGSRKRDRECLIFLCAFPGPGRLPAQGGGQ